MVVDVTFVPYIAVYGNKEAPRPTLKFLQFAWREHDAWHSILTELQNMGLVRFPPEDDDGEHKEEGSAAARELGAVLIRSFKELERTCEKYGLGEYKKSWHVGVHMNIAG